MPLEQPARSAKTSAKTARRRIVRIVPQRRGARFNLTNVVMSASVDRELQPDPATTITRDHEEIDDLGGERVLPRLILAFDCQKPFESTVRFMLNGLNEVVIGRGATRCWLRGADRLEIQIADGEVSRQHVRLQRQPEGWEVIDLGSKNGTCVNGTQVSSAMLMDGDLIECGTVMFIYRDECAGTQTADDLDLASASSLPP